MLIVSVVIVIGLLNKVQTCQKECLSGIVQLCPKKCKCFPEKANCTISNTNVPKLPHYVSWLVLFKSNYRVLTKESFKNFENNSIERLSFKKCNINRFSSDAFKNLEHLLRLDIIQSKNISPKVISEINLKSTKLEKLYFINNNWKTLPEKLFKETDGNHINLLSISGNKLGNITKYVFSGLNKLQVLILKSNNFLGKISFEGTPNSVTKLSLSTNNLIAVPVLCVNEKESYLPFLEILNLENNHISKIESPSLICMRNLKELNLKGNQLLVIKRYILQALPNLLVLNLSCQSGGVKMIDTNAFDSRSLSLLSFRDNGFKFHANKDMFLFSRCPNLTFVDLSKNHFKYKSPAIKKLFYPLKNLETLILAETQLTSLPIDLFPHMRSLRELILTGNHITGWNNDPRVFGNVIWLRKLKLDKNKIKLINKTSFSKSMLSSLESLDLSENRFSCSCRLRWFRNWIDNNGSKIMKNWPDNYTCKLPPMIEGTPLKDFSISEDNCIKPNPVITAAIVISIVIFVIVIVANIVDNYCSKVK